MSKALVSEPVGRSGNVVLETYLYCGDRCPFQASLGDYLVSGTTRGSNVAQGVADDFTSFSRAVGLRRARGVVRVG